jgi:hypothetical protein
LQRFQNLQVGFVEYFRHNLEFYSVWQPLEGPFWKDYLFRLQI